MDGTRVIALFEHVAQLSISDSKVKWPLCFTFSYVCTVLQTKNSSGNASVINPVATDNLRAQLLITDLKVKWPLRFAFTYFQPFIHSITNEEQC